MNITESERERGKEWLATINDACDQIQSTVETYPGLEELTHEQVNFRMAAIFSPREWTAENIDGNVSELLDDILFGDVPAALLVRIHQSFARDIRFRQSLEN